ncbi:hypothetical protein INR49_023766 [Caranx melampygus]|nr:hypothetical protein INR49_023766 [Caranx melampygus]
MGEVFDFVKTLVPYRMSGNLVASGQCNLFILSHWTKNRLETTVTHLMFKVQMSQDEQSVTKRKDT